MIDPDQLFRHLMMKYFNQYVPDQIGVVVRSDIDDGTYVIFHDGNECKILEGPEGVEEFSTVSYGALN